MKRAANGFLRHKRPGKRPSRGRLSALVAWGSLLFALLLGFGFTLGASVATTQGGVTGTVASGEVQVRDGGQTSATLTKHVKVVALGDSLTRGFGDESGRGYVGDAVRQLRQMGYAVTISNLGVNGLTSTGLLQKMRQPEVKRLLSDATLVLLSIGGNDLAGQGGPTHIRQAAIHEAQIRFLTNFHEVLKRIRAVNPHAVIFVIGLYNPYSDYPNAAVTNQIINTWMAAEEHVAAEIPRTVVVQTSDLFAIHPTKYLYVDHFHPNEAGYARISDRLMQDISAAR